MLPHPDKLKTGGEDAYFISSDHLKFGEPFLAVQLIRAIVDVSDALSLTLERLDLLLREAVLGLLRLTKAKSFWIRPPVVTVQIANLISTEWTILSNKHYTSAMCTLLSIAAVCAATNIAFFFRVAWRCSRCASALASIMLAISLGVTKPLT